jgi:curved DNA-binding protein CbpA
MCVRADLSIHLLTRHVQENRADGTKRFQVINHVYGVLGDEEKRRVYDATGALRLVSAWLPWLKCLRMASRSVAPQDTTSR